MRESRGLQHQLSSLTSECGSANSGLLWESLEKCDRAGEEWHMLVVWPCPKDALTGPALPGCTSQVLRQLVHWRRQHPRGPHATLPELCSLLKMQLLLCPHSCFLHKYCHSWWSSLVPSAKVKVLVTPSRSTLCYPMDYSPPGSRPWNSPGKNTGVGCRSFLHGVLPIQGSNPGLLHCRQILYHLNHLGRLSAKIIPSVLSTPCILSVTEPLEFQLVNISWFLFLLPFPPYYFSSSTCHHHRIGHLEKLFSRSPVHLLLPVQIILFLKSKFDCPSSKPCRDPFSLQEKE